MIESQDFCTALHVLHKMTNDSSESMPHQDIAEEWQGQHPFTAAIKILNKVVLVGSAQQKDQLLKRRHEIIALNGILNSPLLNEQVQKKLGMQLGEEAARIRHIQIAIPQTKMEKMLSSLTKIPCIVFTVLFDLVLFPQALILLTMAYVKMHFNPSADSIKKGKIPILLVHGSGFNESEWIVGRQFLRKDAYGSVFSLNYDGLVSNDPKMGIDDYARGKVRDKIKEISRLTESNQVILIGHSMGGMISGYYAEHHARDDGINVKHVICIASPWQGTPVIDNFWKLKSRNAKENETKRHRQMSVCGGLDNDPAFRRNLVAQALQSERTSKRSYYNIWSTTDYGVPGESGNLTEDPRRQWRFSYLGHYALVVWPSVWFKVREWLDQIYR